MRMLCVVHHWPPDVNSTGLLMSKLFERLTRKGHSVEVISTFPHYEGFKVWADYKGRLAQIEQRNGVVIKRVYSHTSGTKSMRSRLLNYLTFNFAATVAAILRRRRHDLVFCTNGSFFSGLTGYLAGLRHRAPVIYNVQDLYPEVPIMQGQLTSKTQIRILAAIERFMYRRAQVLTVITPSFKENIASKGIDPGKIEVIPNFVDIEFIRPLEKDNDFARRQDLVDRFVVSHAGNIGYVYDLETMLDAAKLLEGEPDILFLIVGNGVSKPGLERKAEELTLGNVRFLPFQPHEDLPDLRAASDVQVALYRPGASRFSMPSKLYELMASGRPVIASGDDRSDMRDLVEGVGCGLYLGSADAGGLATAIETLRKDPGLRSEMGARGRREAEERYSVDAVAGAYEALFRRVAGVSNS